MEHIIEYFIGSIVIAAMAIGFIALMSQITDFINLM